MSVFSNRPIQVEFSESVVAQTRSAEPKPGLPYLAPGFIDLQVNGYRGIDYSSPSLGTEDVAALVTALAVSGTTTHLPTIITSSRELILESLRTIETAREADPLAAAAIPGYHIEGPFISSEDGARGAHSLAHVRPPDYEEYRRWQEAAGGHIRIVTLAPELPGALRFIERITADGVIASIGHTAAAPELIRDAVKAGASMSTHLGNGSHAFVPRLKNYIWEQLATDELTASIITDGYHLPPAVMKSFARAKELKRLVLVSDVAVHGGAEPGIYTWGDNDVEVFADGHLGIHKTDFLAGAGHLLDHDVETFIRATSASLSEAVRLCTLAPARLLQTGLGEDFTKAGSRADFVRFSYSEGDGRIEVLKTVLAGRPIYEREKSAPRGAAI